jgi:MoxR-like ATPase
MKPSRIKSVLDRLWEARWPAFLWGPPGTGKSSIVREAAAQRKLEVVDIRAPLLDPTDLRGIPHVHEGRAEWCPPSFLPTEEQEGILFFDELNAAPPLVQASLYQLTLDRRVGEYRLPDGWRIVAAGNRDQDGAVTFKMPSALANRFIHVDFEVDLEDWRRWAVRAGVEPMVIGFVSVRPELLNKQDRHARAFPTPRSWEMVSDALGALGGLDQAKDLLPGVVGEGAAIEFIGFAKAALGEKDLQRIVDDPKNAALPEGLESLYVLCSYLMARARDMKVRAAIGALITRLPVELSVMMVRNLAETHPKVLAQPGVAAFLGQHKQVLA